MQQVLFEIPLPFGDARLPIFGFGMMLLVSILLAGWVAQRRAQQVGIDPDIFWDLGTWFILGGLVGCRLTALLLEERPAGFWDGALQFFKIWEGGMVFYGLIPGAAVAYLWVYWRILRPKGIRSMLLGDVVAPSLALGLALGRIGCLLNGCCYGDMVDPTAVPAWQTITFPGNSYPQRRLVEEGWQLGYGFILAEAELPPQRLAPDPREVQYVDPRAPAAAAGLKPGDVIVAVNGKAVGSLGELHLALRMARAGQPLDVQVRRAGGTEPVSLTFDMPRSLPVHPSQIFSAIDATLLFVLAWLFFPVRRREGQVLALVMFVHGFSRFFLEQLRLDNPPFALGLTVSQLISLGLIGAGAALFGYLVWRGRPVEAAAPAASGTGKV
ncbi:MAG TPA: prolipoprotein diacylglyceryl transferase [Gemmatales bacterium]|nr:prolipoprotein diacylglyceryl transferase [Gemmatales bacterium]HMP58997.1 prolipoprotein diacylglyceryl transferase [Gemmatales bacterium]